MKNVIVRALSGIVYVGLIVAAVLCGNLTLCILLALFGSLALIELSSITNRLIGATEEGGSTIIPYSIILDFLGLATSLIIGLGGNTSLLICFAVIVAYVPVRVCAGLYEHKRLPLASRVVAIAMSVSTTLYVCISFVSLMMMESAISRYLVLNIFILIWLNDTGAFCFGSTLGKRKLWPELSPKKSWEGFWGGMLCCVVYAVVCYFLEALPELSLIGWIAMALVVCVFSTWGDLFESMLKRAAGVKDSGHIIPGHGGILDRIDSLLAVAPIAMIVALFFLS